MRQCTLIGHLKETPQLRRTPQDTPVTDFTVIVRERAGETWLVNEFKCVAWSATAERIARQGRAGDEVVVICKPECREYTDKNSRPRRSTDYVVSWVRVCVADDQPAGAKDPIQ